METNWYQCCECQQPCDTYEATGWDGKPRRFSRCCDAVVDVRSSQQIIGPKLSIHPQGTPLAGKQEG